MQHREPRASESAEIIVKQTFLLRWTKADQPKAIPVILLLANRDGFRYLADLFSFLANRNLPRRDLDPDGHIHEETHHGGPWNSAASDDIEFRIGSLEPNRAAVEARYDLSEGGRHTDLIARYAEIIAAARKAVRASDPEGG